MIYILGSSGIIAKKIKKKFKFKKKIVISTKDKSNCIKTKIFDKKTKEDWIKNINEKDIIFFLFSFGDMNFHERNKKKIQRKITNLNYNFFDKINNKCRIIYFSSDMVFGISKKVWNDRSKCTPLNEYGKTKLKIERIIKKKFNNFLILRLPKIYSDKAKDKIFPYNHVAGSKKNTIHLIEDNTYHYINIDYITKNLFKEKIYKKTRGIFNFPYKKAISRYDFFMNFTKENNIRVNKNRIKKISYKKSKIKIPKSLNMKTKLKLT